MKYVYPAVFHPNQDGSITVLFPDLPGCITEGRGLEETMKLAQDAMVQWLASAADHNLAVAPASAINTITCEAGEFVSLVYAETKESGTVRRNVSIPKWMDNQATKAGLSLSKVLQDALAERLGAV